FGRGIYVVDDYSPVRAATPATLTTAATLFPVRDTVLYVPRLDYGLPGKAFQGEMLYAAPNPPFGVQLTYYVKDGIKTLKEKRIEAEKEAPAMLLTVSDAAGTPVRVVTGPIAKGLQRVAWDLRAPAHQLPPNRP